MLALACSSLYSSFWRLSSRGTGKPASGTAGPPACALLGANAKCCSVGNFELELLLSSAVILLDGDFSLSRDSILADTQDRVTRCRGTWAIVTLLFFAAAIKNIDRGSRWIRRGGSPTSVRKIFVVSGLLLSSTIMVPAV